LRAASSTAPVGQPARVAIGHVAVDTRLSRSGWHAALGPRFPERPTALAHRAARVEQRMPPAALAVARRESTVAPHGARRHEGGSAPLVAASPARPRTAPEMTLAEIEHAVTAKVERRLDRKMDAALRNSLGVDASLARALTDRVYTALYDR